LGSSSSPTRQRYRVNFSITAGRCVDQIIQSERSSSGCSGNRKPGSLREASRERDGSACPAGSRPASVAHLISRRLASDPAPLLPGKRCPQPSDQRGDVGKHLMRHCDISHLEGCTNVADIHFRHSRPPLQGVASGHFEPFPPARLNGRCPFRRYILVPWSAARPDVQ